MEQSIIELNRSNRELEQFAYVASHDLQEPVRKILFYSDYLLSQYASSLDAKGLDYLQTMQAASRRMRNLIQDILTFSQISKEAITFGPIDMNQVIKDVLDDLEMIIEEKGASVDVESLPTVCGDERMMRQLVSNLIGNSLKYSRPSVAPHITVSSRKKTGSAEIIFADNGIGFDNQYVPQMFGLFQRLHTREKYDGTGLGLAICRKIVDIHGGTIEAKGAEGEGACFFVTLPAQKHDK